MIKGLTITPPVLGRISIGKVVESKGKRIPKKDDQFTITSQVQSKDGWINHPLDEQLRARSDNGKLRNIPVRMLFNDPELNLRAEYTLFDRQTGRPLCVGDGETCQRRTNNGVEQHPCPSPDLCPLAQGVNCKPYARLYVNLSEDDEMGTFVFRTTGFNSIRTLSARLAYYSAVSGNRLSCLPLQLKIRGKSTTQSYRTPIYYVDLTMREGISLKEAIAQARQIDDELQGSGFDQSALEKVAHAGYHNSQFETDDESLSLDEFYEVDGVETGQGESSLSVNNASNTVQASHSINLTPHTTNVTNFSSLEQGLRNSVQMVN